MGSRIIFLASSIADSLQIDAITADTREAVLSDGSVTRPSYGWVGFPDGIGFAQEVDVVSGGAIDHVIRQKASRKQLTLQFAWKGSDAYAQYQLFCAWFGRYLNLDDYRIRLSYLVGDAYYRRYVEASVTNIELEELTTGSATATVSFQPLTPWYEEVEGRTIYHEEAEGKSYDYVYPYTYVGTTYSGENQLENGYIENVPLRIVLTGPMTSPRVVCLGMKDDGATEDPDRWYNAVSFLSSFSIAEGETVTIDAIANRIYKTSADGTAEDVFNSVNKGGDSFLYAPPGISRIACPGLDDSNKETDAKCEVYFQRYVI